MTLTFLSEINWNGDAVIPVSRSISDCYLVTSEKPVSTCQLFETTALDLVVMPEAILRDSSTLSSNICGSSLRERDLYALFGD